MSLTAEKRVLTLTAEEQVIIFFTQKEVVAATAHEGIVTGPAQQQVAPFIPRQHIRLVRTGLFIIERAFESFAKIKVWNEDERIALRKGGEGHTEDVVTCRHVHIRAIADQPSVTFLRILIGLLVGVRALGAALPGV